MTAVAPRFFYTRSLPATPEAKRPERLRLWSFVSKGLRPDVRSERVVAALRATRVDIACVRERAARSRWLLLAAGYRPLVHRRGYWCAGQCGTEPRSIARRASSARLRFWGTSAPMPKRSNITRRWLLTVSTLTNRASAISLLEAGPPNGSDRTG